MKGKEGKIRINVTVDRENLERAKTKLRLFGGKLSTLFNAYLADFVVSMDKNYGANQKELARKVAVLEDKVHYIEQHLKSK